MVEAVKQSEASSRHSKLSYSHLLCPLLFILCLCATHLKAEGGKAPHASLAWCCSPKSISSHAAFSSEKRRLVLVPLLLGASAQ